jgi:hypothetical protein
MSFEVWTKAFAALAVVVSREGDDSCGRGALHQRHCEEPTDRANARPMTGSATKQSIAQQKESWIASLRSQ